jgi:hypothetical protein
MAGENRVGLSTTLCLSLLKLLRFLKIHGESIIVATKTLPAPTRWHHKRPLFFLMRMKDIPQTMARKMSKATLLILYFENLDEVSHLILLSGKDRVFRFKRERSSWIGLKNRASFQLAIQSKSRNKMLGNYCCYLVSRYPYLLRRTQPDVPDEERCNSY